MSTSFRYEQARSAADFLVGLLQPYCERIEIAGSLRRGSQVVKDIEIVAQGAISLEPIPGKLFGETRPFNHLEHRLETVSAGKVAAILRPKQHLGRTAPWGPRYKKLWVTHGRSTFVVDLFQPTAETWGPTLVIRTGPADFSRLLVTQQVHGGAMPRGLRQYEGRLERSAGPNADCTGLHWEPVETLGEDSYFDAIGLPCWPPHERTEARLVAWLRDHGVTPPTRATSGDKAPYSPYGSHSRPAVRSHFQRR